MIDRISIVPNRELLYELVKRESSQGESSFEEFIVDLIDYCVLDTDQFIDIHEVLYDRMVSNGIIPRYPVSDSTVETEDTDEPVV